MNRQNTAFDWNDWYASIPGIPLDWGRISAPAGKTEGHSARFAGSHRLGSLLTMRGRNILNQSHLSQSPLPPSL